MNEWFEENTVRTTQATSCYWPSIPDMADSNHCQILEINSLDLNC